MIFFTAVGLGLAIVFFVVVALAGIFQALFNDIGGNGSKWSSLAGVAIFLIGIFGVRWVLTFSPFTIVVAP